MKQSINVGAPNDGTGDTLRAAFVKANANFTELYDRVVATEARLLAFETGSPTVSRLLSPVTGNTLLSPVTGARLIKAA